MRLARFMICATVMSATTPLGALAAPFAYVSNEGSASVSVIDTATDKVTATFNVGGKPRGIALAPDQKRLYVSDQAANAALIVDTSNGALLTKVALGSSPEGIYLSSDGRLLSAAVEEDDLVLLIETATAKVVRRVKMRGKM